jgi:hypothetical protein
MERKVSNERGVVYDISETNARPKAAGDPGSVARGITNSQGS